MATEPAGLATLPQVRHARERIAVFRALQLGDMLCAVPALRALRAARPGARITLIGLPWAGEFARRFQRYIDDFIAFPGAPGLPERIAEPEALERFYAHARTHDFDLVMQMHGDGRVSNAVVQRVGARVIAGFHPLGAPCPDPEHFLAYPEHQPEVQRLLRLISFIGIRARGEDLEFPIGADEWKELARLRRTYGLRPGQYVCIHPGARAAARRWLPERFAGVADVLAARGWRVVLTGSAHERELTRAVARSMHAAVLDLAGATAVGTLAALLAGARLLVCNDTAVSHMAAALSVPSVVVYTGSSPARWAPLNGDRHRAVFRAVDCRPCAHQVCPIGHPCAAGVTVTEVLAQAEQLI